jgi:hypothetical protein
MTMDPLSLTTSAIAILQISGVIINTCYDYRIRAKNIAKDASRIINELNGLRTVLEDECNEKVIQNRVLGKFAETDRPLARCETCLKELAKKLELKAGWRAAREAIFGPLRESEMVKTLQDISSTKSTVQLALALDQRY